MSTETEPLIPFASGVYHVEEGFAPPDFRVAAANTVAHLHKTAFKNHNTAFMGHILVYAPGSGEIDTICTMIRKATSGRLDVFPLYSTMPSESQAEALRGTRKPKCIVATSLSMDAPVRDSIRYVVDTGLCKQHIYNPRLNMHTLETRLIARSQASRREAVATEGNNGVCIRLYSESALLAMPSSKDSDKTAHSAHIRVFRQLVGGERKLTHFVWEPRIHPDTLARAVQDLVVWDLVDEDGNLTDRGKSVSGITTKLAGHQLEPIWANAIYEASRLGCMDEVITIAALCTGQRSIFQEQPGMEKIASISRAKFAYGPSDHLALLNAYTQYQQIVDRGGSDQLRNVWCRLHFLNASALEDAYKLRVAIKKAASELQPEEATPTECSAAVTSESCAKASSVSTKSEGHTEEEDEEEDYDDCVRYGRYMTAEEEELTISEEMKADPRKHANILKAITRAFCTQIAISQGSKDKYSTVDTNVTAMLHASCTLVGLQPQWVVYTQLSRRSRLQFLDTVSVVDDLKNFQPDALAVTADRKARQPVVKAALDAARVKAAAALLSRTL